MGTMAGGEEPTAGIRVSDAERDAAVERLSAATGDGRLTLQEFSQRMELATAARTRADLDGLVADLPADSATAGSAVAGPPSWHVSPIGGLRIRGPWRMDRHVIVVSLVGGARLDLSQAQLAAPQVMLTKVSLVGGTKVTVPPGIRVEASGFSLIGGTRIDAGPQPGPGAPIVRIRAFALVGGIRIRRSGTSERLRQQHHGLAARSLPDASTAPAAATRPALSAPAVAITSAPRCLASWTISIPVTPPAPWTSTVAPGPAPSAPRRTWSAVRAGTGSAPATWDGTASGTGATSLAAATNHCAHAPWARSGSEWVVTAARPRPRPPRRRPGRQRRRLPRQAP